MSLVNDMLADLDTRRASQPKQNVDLEWLAASYSANGSRSVLLKYIPVLIIAVCIIFVAVYYRPW
jgi:hypothetical protein